MLIYSLFFGGARPRNPGEILRRNHAVSPSIHGALRFLAPLPLRQRPSRAPKNQDGKAECPVFRG
jgi:hypothetical protein